jgi:hypothetical protein
MAPPSRCSATACPLAARTSDSESIADELDAEARFCLPHDANRALVGQVAALTLTDGLPIAAADFAPEHEITIVAGPEAADKRP